MLTLFFLVILASVMVLNFKTASEFVQNQLYTDAKNTAHSLGLSLSKVADPKDTSTMDTMINAIFDSGYYERIVLKDLDGKILYERKTDLKVHDVPQWFVENVVIHNANASTDIMMGWSRFGSLEVSGHTGNAYRQLYLTFINLIETFVGIGAVVFGVLYLILSISLQSLKRIRDQANGIIENKFIFENQVPFTTEFRSATAAMNAMVAKVKDIYDRENETLRRYHELLYKDTETKLYNRRYVTAKLPDYLQSHTALSSGVFAMFSFNEIERFKREKGYHEDSVLLNLLADTLNTQLGALRNVMIARVNESDFFAVIPEYDIEALRNKVDHVMQSMELKMEDMGSLTSYLILGCGIGTYSEEDTLKSLLSRADHTVTEAKNNGNFTINVSIQSEESLILGREEWRNELFLSLQESRMMLAFQNVVEYTENGLQTVHEEIFLRLLDKKGTIHNAGYFIPVATSLGLIEILDHYMIEKALSHLKEKNITVGFAINLSGDFVKKYSNIEWLRNQLEAFRSNSSLVLSFEVSNSIAIAQLEEVQSLSDMVKTFGCRFGIDHFAFPESGATYLTLIRPDYVKANGAYLQDILYDKETGHVRESLNNLAKSLGIELIALNIEEAKQMEELKKLGLKRFQGSFISPVSLLS